MREFTARPPQSVIYSDRVLTRYRRRFGSVPEYVEKKLYFRCLNNYKGRRWVELR